MTPTAARPKRDAGVGRSTARLAAVQALYQIDHSGTPGDQVLEEFLKFRLGDSFDTEHDSLLNDHGLSNIERTRGLQHTHAMSDVGFDIPIRTELP